MSDDDRRHIKTRLKRLGPAVRRAVKEARARAERCQVVAALAESKRDYQALADRERRLASIVETAMDAIITIDGQQRIVLFNAAAEEMFACPIAEAIGTPIARFIPEHLRASHREHVEHFLAHGSTKRAMGQLLPLAARRANGEEFPMEAAISRVQAGDQRLATVVVRDISARRAAETALLRSQQQLRLAHQIGRTGSFDWKIARNEVCFSAEVAPLYGFPAEALVSTYEAWHEWVHPADHALVDERIAAALQSGDYDAEFRVIWPDGSEHWLAGRGAVFRDERGRPDSMLGVNIDITDRKAAEETTRRRAQHDPLTGLPNRALLRELAEHLLPAMRRGHSHAAVLFVDLDRFKPINDTYGHDVGDAVLKEVAKRLADSMRGEDLVARLGGDEFVAVLAHIHGEADAATIAVHVIDRLGQPYLAEGVELNVSPSIGISLFPRDGEAMDELIKHADAAMYAAKAHGRNTFEFYQPAPDARSAAGLPV